MNENNLTLAYLKQYIDKRLLDATGPPGPPGPQGPPGEPGGGATFTTDETLTLSDDGVLSVNVADEVEDNTLPITAAAVHTTVGNIEILLATI